MIIVMKKAYILTILCIVLHFCPSVSSGQEIPSLPDDPAISRGELPDGISYYIAVNTSQKGMADYVLVRKGWDAEKCRMLLDSLPKFAGRSPAAFLADNGIGYGRRGYVQDMDGDVVLRFENVRLPAGESVTDSLLLAMFDIVDAGGPSEGDAIVISGDVDKDDVVKRLKILSLMVPARANLPYKDTVAVWQDRDFASCGLELDRLARVPSLTVSYRSPRTPREYMGTVLLSVSERLGEELWTVLKKRVEDGLVADTVPVAGLKYRYVKSSEQKGDESYSVSVMTSPARLYDAAGALGGALSSLDRAGASVGEYSDAKKMANSALYKKVRRVSVPNSQYVDKCISSFLYGAGLASAGAKEQFYTRGMMPDTSGCRLFNGFASALLDSAENLSVVCRADSSYVSCDSLLLAFKAGWRMGTENADTMMAGHEGCMQPSPVNWSDTLRFPVPAERCTVRRTKTVTSTGSTDWVFSNGMKVLYKKMDTDGIFYYSMLLKGGYASMRDMKNGEGAFMSDMLGLYDVCGMDCRDFRNLLETAGISMHPEVAVSAMSISGALPSDRLSLLMKSLLAMSDGLSLNRKAAARYMREERLRLATLRGDISEKMFVMDSIICRDDRYSPFKSAANLHADLPERAGKFFKTQFSKADDGVLVFVGDMSEVDFKKFLQSYMGGFKTVRRRVLKPVVSYQIVSGESTYFVDGDVPGVDVLMSAELPMNPENYMVSQVAVMALKDALTEAVHDTGMYVSVKDAFPVYPYERLCVTISASPASIEGLPQGTARRRPVRVLMKMRSAMSDLVASGISPEKLSLYKAVLQNRWDSLQKDPGYWLAVISGRFAGGKDMQSRYSECISSVDAAKVQDVLQLLQDGSRIEYVTKSF